MSGRGLSVSLSLAVLLPLMVSPKAPAATPESKAAAVFLLYRPGARELAMGEAGAASAAGHSASGYNPALLARQENTLAAGATYYAWSIWFLEYTYWHASAMYSPAKNHHLAASVTSAAAESRGVTEFAAYNPYDRRTRSFCLTYCVQVTATLSLGMSAKWFSDRVPDFANFAPISCVEASGVLFDCGVVYIPVPRLALGAALRNYGPNATYTDVSQSAPTPVNLSIGADVKALRTKNHSVTLAGELYKPLVQDYRRAWYLAPVRGWTDEGFREERRQIDVHLGAEYGWRNRLFVRGGFYRDWDGNRKWFTYGAGLRWPVWKIAVSADMSVIHATGRDDPEDRRRAFSLGLAL